jgi:predicted nuclease of predicted toxin-antitoxin system
MRHGIVGKARRESAAIAHSPVVKARLRICNRCQQGWSTLSDTHLWPLVVKEGRFFITSDKDFADHLRYVPGEHPGVLVLILPRMSPAGLHRLLVAALQHSSLDKLAGCVAIASIDGIVVRRPRIEKSEGQI